MARLFWLLVLVAALPLATFGVAHIAATSLDVAYRGGRGGPAPSPPRGASPRSVIAQERLGRFDSSVVLARREVRLLTVTNAAVPLTPGTVTLGWR